MRICTTYEMSYHFYLYLEISMKELKTQYKTKQKTTQDFKGKG